MGLVLAPLAVIAQWILSQIILLYNPSIQISNYSWFYVGAALIEEVVKFLAVQFVVIHNPEFDEPIDAMEYMIASALGFAAIENILVLFQSIPNGTAGTIQVWFYRFAGATFLHALSSAIVGYFLALSWFHNKHSEKLIPVGLLLATIVHFVFNGLVLYSVSQSVGLLNSSLFLIITALVISAFFLHLRRTEEEDEAKHNFSTNHV